MKTNNSDKKIVTRFAPSPTGFLHMGGVRTALFSFLYAKQHDGEFVLRIEDTDKERNKEEWTTALIEDLAWLGITHDTFAKQSERVDKHSAYIQKMIDDGFAYISKEEPKEAGQRDEVIRFKNPNKKVTFSDLIRGEVEVDTTDLGDFVIARSLTEPIYHLAVVVDDFDMGITHVIRAEEHLSNTPRQILIQDAIGAPRPIYAHLPLVLAPDKSKLSKRKHGETVSLTYYRDLGFLPEAILNFVALLGWNPGTDQEIMSLEEIQNMFDIQKVQKGGAVFNVEKLRWVNKEHLKKLSPEVIEGNILERLKQYSFVIDPKKIVPIIFERIEAFGDVTEMVRAGELDYVMNEPEATAEMLVWKKQTPDIAVKHLLYVREVIEQLSDEKFSAELIKESLWDYATEEGRGDVLWPTRVALSGKEKSPDPFTLIALLGKEISLQRIDRAIKILS
jgi:glutamyl-tRNA synthetase